MERQVSPVPPDAQIIRGLISRIEACRFKYQRHIEHIIRSIGQMQTDIDPDSIGKAHPKSGVDAWRKDSTGRSRRGQEFIRVLQMWLDEKPPPGEKHQRKFYSLSRGGYIMHSVKRIMIRECLSRRLLTGCSGSLEMPVNRFPGNSMKSVSRLTAPISATTRSRQMWNG